MQEEKINPTSLPNSTGNPLWRIEQENEADGKKEFAKDLPPSAGFAVGEKNTSEPLPRVSSPLEQKSGGHDPIIIDIKENN